VKSTIQVIAHRGARSIAPENTLRAAEIAHDLGADLWETDVNITRDGKLILFHDETLLRCTNAASRFPRRTSYCVRAFDLQEIQSLDAGSFYVQTDPFSQIAQGKVKKETLAEFSKEHVPTLEQGLVLTRQRNWRVNLELKRFSTAPIDNRVPDLTLETIYRSGIDLERVVISSFHHDWLERILIKEPSLEIQALVGETDEGPLDFSPFSFPTYNAHADLIDPDQIRQLKACGKKVNLFTVNDPKSFFAFEALGVDGIFTDFPQWFAHGHK
jgi:glycerophosphoryl diester phosphodiesterase